MDRFDPIDDKIPNETLFNVVVTLREPFTLERD